ncbi:MAG: HlyD family efflux transporter periplasmic adaptor subunit [Alphaproteobacteria bacterium]|nr:HlyD family efflux transporter periplasmic adaptor subunit [Alphaproteobacteria bacterium]
MTQVAKLIVLALAALLAAGAGIPVLAHEGHDHDKPPPLNLPVAPRIIAVTPQLELVGVVSGSQSLTVFLHEFASNEPIAGAKMTVSGDGGSVEAKPDGVGVFIVEAPWVTMPGANDLIFALTFAGGMEDLLTGRLEVPESLEGARQSDASPASSQWYAVLLADQKLLWALGGSFVAGVLLTLLLMAGRGSPSAAIVTANSKEGQTRGSDSPADANVSDVTPLRRSAGIFIFAAAASAFVLASPGPANAAQEALKQMSIPSTMATDQPQRMPDATVFVPKATQHLLSIRTKVAVQSKAARAMEMTGRVIAGPQNLGRVQSDRPGRFQVSESAASKVPFVGMSVKKGDVLGFVETYIEESDRANIVSQIAETEALIVKNRTILSRYRERPGSVPKVREDEVAGELESLIKKREQLLPSTSAIVPLIAPISGVVSTANVVAGQVVETRDVLFEIIDPSEFWIEAVAQHPEDASNIASAVATVHDHHRLDLKYVGRGLALRHHSAILNFRVDTPDEDLAVGMTARVILQSQDEVEGFVLPSSAVVRGPTGLPIVWVKSQPERFEPYIVKFEPFDGERVVITAGIKTEQRIVVDGVTLLNQIR